jgi:hypothetical protein
MQMSLINETITDAVQELVKAAGGAKVVGQMLYPELAADHAGNKLRACLDDERREKFSPQQIVFLLRLGRQVGCHALMIFMAREAGYSDPVPVDPENEIARLQREFVEATKSLHHMASRIEAISATAAIRRAA